MAGISNDYIRWGGQAGQTIYIRQSDGSWASGGAPEHAESASYVQRAVDDGSVLGFLKYAYDNPAGLNTEQRAFLANPLLGLDSYGQGYRWGSIDLFDNSYSPQQAGALLQTGMASYLSPADIQAGQAFNFEQSPAEQSKRAGGDDWFGSLVSAAAIAAAAWAAWPAIGAAGGTAAAAEVGAMSVPGAYGAMSTTAALAPSLGASISGVAATGATLGALDLASNAAWTSSIVSGLKTAKTITDTVNIVNKATQQKSTVPANAPIPQGWAVDAGLMMPSSALKYDPATGAIMETPQGTPQSGATPQNIVPPSAGGLSSGAVLALAGLGLILYLVK